jgi:CRISPR-associated protein Cmx8
LVSVLPRQRTIDDEYFSRDAREAFKHEALEGVMTETQEEKIPKTIEELVYRIVWVYIKVKTEDRTGHTWDEVKDQPGPKKEFDVKWAKVAKDAFLAVRSRSGDDFIQYFSTTLCSAPQRVGEEGYRLLVDRLLTQPETVRTLTLLALSARG